MNKKPFYNSIRNSFNWIGWFAKKVSYFKNDKKVSKITETNKYQMKKVFITYGLDNSIELIIEVFSTILVKK